jgi:dipeptidyl aminopeptidase/acylaminoacyl peptidase
LRDIDLQREEAMITQRRARTPRTGALAFLFLFLLSAGYIGYAEAQQGQGLTPLHVARIQGVTGAVISPDGRHVAYTVAVPADPLRTNAPAAAHLHLHDRRTGETRALYTQGSVANVAFRPAHNTITFLAAAEQGVPRAVYEVPLAGGTPQRVYGFDRAIQAYSWAPDGVRLAFTATEEVTPPVSPLPYQPEFYEENQPHRLAYVVDVAAGGAARQIQRRGTYYLLEWSPRGDRIAVAVAPTPSVDDSYMRQSVEVVDATTLQVVADIQNEGKLGQVVWSPDGRRLALRAGHDINDPIDGRILVVGATGGVPVDIRPDFPGKFEEIAWVGNNEIQFLASQGVESFHGRIRPDGSRLERIAGAEGLALTRFDRSGAGPVAFVASTARHPAELFVLAGRETVPTRVTRSNPWLADLPLGEQRVVRYTARDGEFEIEGLLLLPVGYVEGQRVPLITVVHGGPEAHYLNGWLTGYSMPGQMATARGYAVFYPNYRGSTGRGLEFVRSSQGDPAGKEFDDVVDGIDHLIALGIVDRDRVGVTGGSYGGYATAWMSTYYSDRFAAGVMFVGISNNISKWGTSDIPDELYLVHDLERIWDDNWDKYLERSPIYHVDRARTPLLIMHGAQDTRVHPAQSMELYRHLVVRRPEVPVRLVFYPDEGHGNVRSASRLDYTLRMMGWFEAYLMGDGTMPGLDLELPAAAGAPVPVEVGAH